MKFRLIPVLFLVGCVSTNEMDIDKVIEERKFSSSGLVGERSYEDEYDAIVRAAIRCIKPLTRLKK